MFSSTLVLVAVSGIPATSSLGEKSAVIFLLDEKAVYGFGHAAVLVGDKSGWDYYSFGPHSKKEVIKNNLVHQHFDSFPAACASKELRRYQKYLSWTTADQRRTELARQHVLKVWDKSSYKFVQRNCLHMVADAVKAGSFTIDITDSFPVTAYEKNKENAASHGIWPVVQR
jgi:hypothetical protein